MALPHRAPWRTLRVQITPTDIIYTVTTTLPPDLLGRLSVTEATPLHTVLADYPGPYNAGHVRQIMATTRWADHTRVPPPRGEANGVGYVTLEPAALLDPLFTTDALDRLLASRRPWSTLAGRYALTDAQYASFARTVLADGPYYQSTVRLDPHVTSLERLALTLSLINPGDVNPSTDSPFIWAQRVGPTEDVLRLVLPFLSQPALFSLLFLGVSADPPSYSFSPPPLSPTLVAEIIDTLAPAFARVDGAFERYLAESLRFALNSPSPPRWYLARLILRTPAVAELLLRSTNIDDPPVALTRWLLTHLTPDPAAVLSLLQNPAVSVEQAFEAATALLST